MSCIVIEKPVIEIFRPQHDVNLSREVGQEVKVVPTGAPGPVGPQGPPGQDGDDGAIDWTTIDW